MDGVQDTMLLWRPKAVRSDRYKADLESICAFLGCPFPKGGMDGSQVYDLWAAGEHSKIREYGKGDVERLRWIFKRMMGVE